MASFLLVARHQYLTMVRKRSFLLGTLAFPLLIAVVVAIAIFTETGGRDLRPLGVVDHANILPTSAVMPDPARRGSVEIRPFPERSAARRALEDGEIQAFYVLPADYVHSRRVELVYWDEAPGDAAREQFVDLIRTSVLADLPPEIRTRAMEGASLLIRSADGRRELAQEDWLSFVLPIAAGLFFMIAVMSSAGYLLQAVTTEKENRTMEVMITSVTPEQLIGGKALGLMSVSLTQLLIWVLAGVIALLVVSRTTTLQVTGIPWSTLAVIVIYFLPAFALVAGLMTAIGSAVTETRQGQQIASVINLFFMAPFFLVALILSQPNSPLMVALSLFPATAFLTVILRWSVTIVPLWQMIASWVLLAGSAAVSVWGAARVLRVGMLRYGQRMDLRAVIRAVRGGR